MANVSKMRIFEEMKTWLTLTTVKVDAQGMTKEETRAAGDNPRAYGPTMHSFGHGADAADFAPSPIGFGTHHQKGTMVRSLSGHALTLMDVKLITDGLSRFSRTHPQRFTHCEARP